MKTIKPGIRLKPNGKYYVTKSIQQKRFFKEFDTLKEAIRWKNEFHPVASPTPKSYTPAISGQSNGKDISIKLGDVLELYQNGKMQELSEYRRYKKTCRMTRFLAPILSVYMCDMAPMVIDNLIKSSIKNAGASHYGRTSFIQELKDLSSVFNWYRVLDFTFINPVMSYHFKASVFGKNPKRKKYMGLEQFVRFTEHLEEPYKSMAIVQFFTAARVGEVAAFNTRTVDFNKREISITETIVWLKGRPIHTYGTKNDDESPPYKMENEVFMALRKMDRARPKGCKYFFHYKGGPMRYGQIQKAYNTALEKAGLKDLFSGTHFVRHTMGTESRRSLGLDASQAILRHKSSRMSEHYAKLDVNEKVSEVVISAEERFLKVRASIASIGLESLVN